MSMAFALKIDSSDPINVNISTHHQASGFVNAVKSGKTMASCKLAGTSTRKVFSLIL